MDVAVTGSSGLIGTALVESLRRDGHRVRRLVRRPPAAADEVGWDPDAGTIDHEALAGVDAVVHLAGESIGDKRWTERQKQRIRDSRVRGTTVVAEAVARLDPRPALLSASGVNYYGDSGDELLTEDSGPGGGFLADVVRQWEGATEPAEAAGARVVHLRSAVVLTPAGGALRRQLPLFRFGVGGKLGNGRFWFPWIAIDDEVGAICHLLTADVEGPVNLGAPGQVTNAEFTRVLGRVLGRPTFLTVPKPVLDIVLGRELADNLFASMRMVPARLETSGYAFRHPELEGALRHVLGR